MRPLIHCSVEYQSSHIVTFLDDTGVVRWRTNSDASDYRQELQNNQQAGALENQGDDCGFQEV